MRDAGGGTARVEARARLIAVITAVTAPLLCGCSSSGLPRASHDARTEFRRERDCADPQWKAANLGLWYNLCENNPF